MRFALLMLATTMLGACQESQTHNASTNGASEAVLPPAEISKEAANDSLPAPTPARPPATAGYRAVGNEPGWSLTIGEEQIIYVGDYGEVKIRQSMPEPIIGVAGKIYRTPRLQVNIVRAKCSDGMSDYVYEDQVQVTADGKRVEGCGGERTLPPGGSPP